MVYKRAVLDFGFKCWWFHLTGTHCCEVMHPANLGQAFRKSHLATLMDLARLKAPRRWSDIFWTSIDESSRSSRLYVKIVSWHDVPRQHTIPLSCRGCIS